MNFLRVFVMALMALIGVNLWWRWASRRQSLPCPSWLAWALEHPLMDRLIGTTTTLDRLESRPGQRILEIGPGPGRLLIPAAERVLPGGAVVGLEIQAKMLERLTARARQRGISNLTAEHGDATQPVFAPDSFGLVYLCTVLGEILDREAALQQCYAALKPGGMLSITEIFPDPHFQPRATVIRLTEEAGFRLKAIHGQWYFFTANFVKV